MHSLFITSSEWGGGTGSVVSCADCLPELHPQMPQKRPAGCILLLTFLGLSGMVGAVTRTYHIGIVEEYWNYVPQGKNVITGKSFAEDKWVKLGSPQTPRFGSFLNLLGEGCIPRVATVGVSWPKSTGGVLCLFGEPLHGRVCNLEETFLAPSVHSLVCEEPCTKPCVLNNGLLSIWTRFTRYH